MQSKITETDSEEGRKLKVLRQLRRNTHVLRILSVNRVLLTVETERFTKYVKQNRGHVYGCYIGEINDELGAVTFLGGDIKVLKLMVNDSVKHVLVFFPCTIGESLGYFKNELETINFIGSR